MGRNMFPGISSGFFLKASVMFISALLLLSCREKMTQKYSGSNKIGESLFLNNPETGR